MRKRAEDRFDIAVCSEISRGHTFDQGRRRLIGNEALSQLVADEVRGVWIGGKKSQRLNTFVHLQLRVLPGSQQTN